MKKKSEKEELSGINQGTSDTKEPGMVEQAQEENVNKQKSPLWKAGGLLGVFSILACAVLLFTSIRINDNRYARYQDRIKTLQDLNADMRNEISEADARLKELDQDYASQVGSLKKEVDSAKENILTEVFGNQAVQRGLNFTFYGDVEKLYHVFGEGWQDRAATGVKQIYGAGSSLTVDTELYTTGGNLGCSGYIDNDMKQRIGIIYYKGLDKFIFFRYEGEEKNFNDAAVQNAEVQQTQTVAPTPVPENTPQAQAAQQTVYDPETLAINNIPGELTQILDPNALRDRLYSYLYNRGVTSAASCQISDCEIFDTYADFTVVLQDGTEIPVEYIKVNNSYSFDEE